MAVEPARVMLPLTQFGPAALGAGVLLVATVGAGVSVALGAADELDDEHAAANIKAATASPLRRLVPLVNVVSPSFWALRRACLLPVAMGIIETGV